MSHPKILSADQVRNVFRQTSEVTMAQVCDSHAAQAERIRELEHEVSVWKAKPLSTTRQERDTALQRAVVAEAGAKYLGAKLADQRRCTESWAEKFDNAEDLLRQIREALPAERARAIADYLDDEPDSREACFPVNDLRKYAALAEDPASARREEP